MTAVVRWLLCLAVGLTAVAHAVKTFRGDGTALNAFLFLDMGWLNEEAARTERVALTTVLVLTVLSVTLVGVLRPIGWLMVPMGLFLLLEAALSVHVGGKPFYELSLAAAALRYGTPLLTPLVLAGYVGHGRRLSRDQETTQPGTLSTWRAWSFRSGTLLLRLAVAVVFLTHGYEAWQHHPRFIDLIIGTWAKYFDVWLDQTLVTQILTVIGVVDILVGVGILLTWNPVLLGWAAFWGLLTALSRMTAFGWGAYPDALFRATHFLVPLALLLLVRSQSQLRGINDPQETGGG